MRGFMCHSVEATSVCTITDPRSVIVPRRPDRTSEDHSRLISSAKYSRLVERHRFDPARKRSVIAPSFRRDDQAVNPSMESIKQPNLLTSSRSLIVPSVKSDHQAVDPSPESIKQPHLLTSSRHLLTSSRSLTVPSVKGDHQAVNPSLEYIKQPHLPTSSTSLTVPSVKSDHQAVEPSMEAIKQPHVLNSSDSVFQVVVMRVSLHCQGCAGKVKKHLSKMEGVTSFSIDLETKRVTVMGHISPNGVLESISKVKRAEFWTS